MKSSFDHIKFTRKVELIEEAHLYRQPILDLILAALLRPSFLHSEQSRARLNNHDVVKLAARLSEDIVVRVIRAYKSDFNVSYRGLLNLRKDGVGDKIIEAMLSKSAMLGVSAAAQPSSA